MDNIKKVLIVEDDKGIIDSLSLYLENSGFEVDSYNTGKNAVEYINDSDACLIILDINLPVKNGIEICREVRETSNIPIIILTARNTELDKVTGLDVGADDYVSKPFSPRVLLARISSILRRLAPKELEKEVEFGEIKMNLNKLTISKSGNLLSFTKSEFDILRKIIQEGGNVVTREVLMTEIIGYEQYIFDRTIDTHIKNIRKKLNDKDIIITVRGEGYRLNK